MSNVRAVYETTDVWEDDLNMGYGQICWDKLPSSGYQGMLQMKRALVLVQKKIDNFRKSADDYSNSEALISFAQEIPMISWLWESFDSVDILEFVVSMESVAQQFLPRRGQHQRPLLSGSGVENLDDIVFPAIAMGVFKDKATAAERDTYARFHENWKTVLQNLMRAFHPDSKSSRVTFADSAKTEFFCILSEIFDIFDKRCEQLYAFLYEVQGQGQEFMDAWVLNVNVLQETQKLKNKLASMESQIEDMKRVEKETEKALHDARILADRHKAELAELQKKLAKSASESQEALLRAGQQFAAGCVDRVCKEIDNRAAAVEVQKAADGAKSLVSEMQQSSLSAKGLVLDVQRALQNAADTGAGIKAAAEEVAARLSSDAQAEAARILAKAKDERQKIIQQAVEEARRAAHQQTETFVSKIKSQLFLELGMAEVYKASCKNYLATATQEIQMARHSETFQVPDAPSMPIFSVLSAQSVCAGTGSRCLAPSTTSTLPPQNSMCSPEPTVTWMCETPFAVGEDSESWAADELWQSSVNHLPRQTATSSTEGAVQADPLDSGAETANVGQDEARAEAVEEDPPNSDVETEETGQEDAMTWHSQIRKRKRLEGSLTNTQLAREFGVSKKYISTVLAARAEHD